MAVVKLSYSSVMLYRCLFVVFGIAERQLPKSCEENDLMNKRTFRRLISAFAALVIGLSVLTGCGTKTAKNVEKQEDAQTIQVYLWTNNLYETYAPYIQSQLPDVNIEFIVGNNDLDFYKFLQENGGLPDIITCCRFSLHDAAPLKDSLMNLALTNEAGAVYNTYLNSFKNEDGSVSKLSKRHGATGFADLINEGYLPQAIINYIALLGWCPKDNQEIFTLEELCRAFSIDGISKSPAVFDYGKLSWFNGEYIKAMPVEQFAEIAAPYFKQALSDKPFDYVKLASILQQRVTQLTQIPEMVGFFARQPEYGTELFVNKKSKTTLENSPAMLAAVIEELEKLSEWNHDGIHDCLIGLAQRLEVKNGTVMWPARISVSGKTVTPGGAVEILDILGKEESLKRMKQGLAKF